MSDSKQSSNVATLVKSLGEMTSEVVQRIVVKEVGAMAAVSAASIAKVEAMLQDVLDRLDRIQAMDNLQGQMLAGQNAALLARPEQKTGKSRAAPKSARGAPKKIANAMHYFKKMWCEDVEFRKRFLSSEGEQIDAKVAAAIGVYEGKDLGGLTPEQKLELETAFAENVAADDAAVKVRKSNALTIWKTGLSAGHKNRLKAERTEYNNRIDEAARPAPLETDRPES